MRIRTIKPEFFDSPDTATASAVTRLAFIGLWCWADDTGRGTCNVKELEGAIFPNDDIEELSRGEFADFCGILRQVAAAYGVLFYEVGGRSFYQIPSWERHQRVRDSVTSRFPGPEEGKPTLTREDAAISPVRGDLPQTAADCGDSRLGTGEQGNRGTGEHTCATEPATTGAELAPLEAGAATAAPERSTKTKNAEPEGFADFYTAYPRHKDRQEASKAYARAIRQGATCTGLLGAAVAFRQASERNGTEQRFIPLPSTWLNKGRWKEDPEILEPQKSRRQQETDAWRANTHRLVVENGGRNPLAELMNGGQS
jgi:hypothetical protein